MIQKLRKLVGAPQSRMRVCLAIASAPECLRHQLSILQEVRTETSREYSKQTLVVTTGLDEIFGRSLINLLTRAGGHVDHLGDPSCSDL